MKNLSKIEKTLQSIISFGVTLAISGAFFLMRKEEILSSFEDSFTYALGISLLIFSMVLWFVNYAYANWNDVNFVPEIFHKEISSNTPMLALFFSLVTGLGFGVSFAYVDNMSVFSISILIICLVDLVSDIFIFSGIVKSHMNASYERNGVSDSFVDFYLNKPTLIRDVVLVFVYIVLFLIVHAFGHKGIDDYSSCIMFSYSISIVLGEIVIMRWRIQRNKMIDHEETD